LVPRNFDSKVVEIRWRNLVKKYILVKGNGEAEEILEDYMKYVHKLGYVVHRP
jgi:hypothetical protein